jgi:hypothetical protein
VLARTGLSFRRLKYAREEVPALDAMLLGDKTQRREWPEPVVRCLEVALTLDQAVPKANVRHSGLPTFIEAVLAGPEPPEMGWMFYDGQLQYAAHPGDLHIENGGLIACIPAPWGLGVRPRVDSGWAVVQER